MPTWNYVAVELAGMVRPLGRDALPGLLDDLSAEFETRLAPKPAWTRARMDARRFEAMLGAISPFEMEVREWRGTRKLGQDKGDEARAGVAEALIAAGERDMAEAMSGNFPPRAAISEQRFSRGRGHDFEG